MDTMRASEFRPPEDRKLRRLRARRKIELRAKAGDEDAQRRLQRVWSCRVYTDAELQALNHERERFGARL